MENEVIGITKFCVHPEHWRKSKVIVGGTKTPDLDKIRALKPDLILGNKEENERATIEALAKEFRVWMSEIYTVEDAIRMIETVGRMTGKYSESMALASRIRDGFGALRQLSPYRTLYLIWHNPWMGVASRTFIHDMIRRTGLINVLASQTRYPELSEAQIQELNPELILLPSEPYPFRDKHVDQLQRLLPNARIRAVDGEMFSWYGSRLPKAIDYLNSFAY